MPLLRKVMKKFIKSSWLGVVGFLFGSAKTFAADSNRQILAIAPPPNRRPIILAIAPMPPSREELFFRLLPFLLVFIAIITSVVGIVWYQRNKITRRWFQFFASKTFFIISVIIIFICVLAYWLLGYLSTR